MADAFKRKLAASRGAVTKSIKKLEELLQDSSQIQEIQAFVDNLTTQATRLEKLNDLVDKVIPEEELEDQYDKIEDYRTDVELCLSVSKNTISNQNANKIHKSKQHQSLKLPKLTLPQFTGEVLEWQEFIETFSITVDKQSLSDIEKLQYLKNCIKGEPAQVLTGLPLTNSNYAVAIDLLKERYGSKRRIIRTHVQALISIQQPNHKSYQSLRTFVDTVKKHLRGLSSLDVDSDNYDIIMCEVLLPKLPTNIKHEWAKLEDTEMVLNKLLSIVEAEAKHLDIMSTHHTESTSKTVISEHKSKSINFSLQEKQHSFKCLFCNNSDHNSYQCPKFLSKSAEDRIKLTKTAKLCVNCLKRHYPLKCTSQHRCKLCKGFHNTLLHIQRSTKDDTQTYQDDTVNVKSTFHKDEQVFQTILPTLYLPIVTNSGVKHVGALIDSGSERSFICAPTVRKLRLTSTQKEKIVIQGFNGPDSNENCDVVKISIRTNSNKTTNISLLVSENMKRIDLPSVNVPLEASTKVSFCKRPETVEIIIGADHYYDIVTGHSHSVNSKLKLMETSVGYALHGLIPSSSISNNFKILFTSCLSVDDSLDVRMFWNNELAGIQPQGNLC